MLENQKMTNIQISELLPKVQAYYDQKYRLVQINCSKIDNNYEINYSFDKDYQYENLKITLTDPALEIPSVSGIYWNAFLYENEMHDLFGVNITNMVLDYKGNFYKTAQKNPFVQTTPKAEDK